MSEQQKADSALREDVTPSGVAALRMAADNMPLAWPGGPWVGAAEWLHRRADAIELHLARPGNSDGDERGDLYTCTHGKTSVGHTCAEHEARSTRPAQPTPTPHTQPRDHETGASA